MDGGSDPVAVVREVSTGIMRDNRMRDCQLSVSGRSAGVQRMAMDSCNGLWWSWSWSWSSRKVMGDDYDGANEH
ncbi:unnamed protein product [Heligmosomoides polygyrus]|uniref:SRCR domain-containing protein n=1 Tax=Heligmosomoides polygyrus TaxID=6339 RepID=A0A183GLK2_HELPZ|nr:unnamed protein product [Heligmosomoides polygyrus]